MDLPATPERGAPCPDLRAYGLPWLDALRRDAAEPGLARRGRRPRPHADGRRRARCATSATRRSTTQARTELWLAALLHDVGKPATTRYENGHYRAPGHARRGAIIARRLLWEAGIEPAARERICALVRHHMVPHHLIERAGATRQCIEISLEAGAVPPVPADARRRARADRRRRRAAGDQRRAVRRVRARARLPGRAVPVRLRPRPLQPTSPATTATRPTPRTTTRAAASSCSPACPAPARTCGSPATATAARSSRSTTSVASAASSAATRRPRAG